MWAPSIYRMERMTVHQALTWRRRERSALLGYRDGTPAVAGRATSSLAARWRSAPFDRRSSKPPDAYLWPAGGSAECPTQRTSENFSHGRSWRLWPLRAARY